MANPSHVKILKQGIKSGTNGETLILKYNRT